MIDNPYDPPADTPPTEPTVKPSHDFLPILVRWEKLRLIYNLILVIVVLAATFVFFPHHLGEPLFWMMLIGGGLVANVCFFVGPAFDGYLSCFMGRSHPAAIAGLFSVGTLFTIGLAISSVATFAVPN